MNVASSPRSRTARSIPGVLLVALLSACAGAPTAGAGPAPAPSPGALQAMFDSVIHVAAVYRPEHVLPLKPAVPDAEGRVRVATYTDWDGYRADSTLALTRDVWVTLVPEVRDSCAGLGAEASLRLEQLLGLPPGGTNDRIVEVSVRLEDLFRPTADPTPTTARPCPDTISGDCGRQFPANVSPEHVRWIADRTLTLWRIPQGYPWTRLGYTYNWRPGSPRYGASEYVVRSGARVRVLSVTPTAEYCTARS